MQIANIREAKTHLSKLVESAAKGTEIVIAKAGQPAARLIPLAAPKKSCCFGILKGKVKLAKNFDAPLPNEILAAFESR